MLIFRIAIFAALGSLLTAAAMAAPSPQISGTEIDGTPAAPQEARLVDSFPRLLSFNVTGATCTGSSCVYETGEDLVFILNHSGLVREYRWDWDGDGTVDQITTTPVVSHRRRLTGTNVVAVTFEGFGAEITPLSEARITVRAVGEEGPPPDPVTGLSAIASERWLAASWDPVEGATGYRLQVTQSNGLVVSGPLLSAGASEGLFRVEVGALPTAVRVWANNEIGVSISETVAPVVQPTWLRDDFETGLSNRWELGGPGTVQITADAIEDDRALAFCSSGEAAYIEPTATVPNGALLDLRARLRFTALQWQPGDTFKFLELLDAEGRPTSYLSAELLPADRYRIRMAFSGQSEEVEAVDLSQDSVIGAFVRLLHAVNERGYLEARLDTVTQDSLESALGTGDFEEVTSFRFGLVGGLPEGASGCFIIDAVEVLSPNP
ncbi:MAG: hypothetical protein AAGD01_15245 [Acidobacteriota bacterium]